MTLKRQVLRKQNPKKNPLLKHHGWFLVKGKLSDLYKNDKKKSTTKKNRWVTLPNKIPSTPSISSFFWSDPPAFPVYGTFPHLVAVTALSTSNCQICKTTNCLGKVKDLLINFLVIYTDDFSIKKNTTHTQIHYRITGDYTQMVDRWQRFRVVYYPRAYCEFWFSPFLENRSITQIVC